jgi:serine/threonine protein kinase/Tfp pilus assembly protein PilF
MENADSKLEPGSAVGNYKIISLLGEGGMGRVFLAEDSKLHRKVSLKFLSASSMKDGQYLRRFEHEARTISALNHPNILTIHEIGDVDGHRFIVTEFIEGQTLRNRLRSPIEIDDALDIAIQVASALVAAHRVNIVHRDIKPENIMIREADGLVKVLDFGLAKTAQPEQGPALASDVETVFIANTGPGVVMGTVAYMSPEQARGDSVDARTDIWSLGVVLYEMVAGCSPFVALTSNEIISAILSKQSPAPLSRYSRFAPERLEEIVEKALTKNRDERYQTIKDLLIDLRRLKQALELKAGIERSASAASNDSASSTRQISDAEPSTAQLSTQPTQPRSSAEYLVHQVKGHKLAAVITVALLALAIGLVYLWRLKQAASTDRPAISSIAVLPFTNASSDPETEFLVDGITDNLIERLSQLPGLKVLSHTAVFHYKGREIDPRKIGTELNVEAILNGRVVKRGDAVTISLELIDVKDNSHIWGEQYDRRLADLSLLQREMPIDISEKLRVRLGNESKERLAQASTANAEAYQLYLKGRYAWEKWTENGSKEAVDYFEQAIKKDPNYAAAYSGLADAYVWGTGLAGMSPKEKLRRGKEAALKALELDPMLGEAHGSLGLIMFYGDWDFPGAEREYKRAIELSPSYAEAHHEYSHMLLALGRLDESLIESKKFLELDPLSESPIGHMGYHYLCTRKYVEAIEEFKKAVERYPDSFASVLNFADAYYYKGMFREAVDLYLKLFKFYKMSPEQLAELNDAFTRSGIKGYTQKRIDQLKSAPPSELDPGAIGRLYARLGDKEQAFEWLEKGYAERSDVLLRLKEDPSFEVLRSDPRYTSLLHRVGLPE